MSTVLANSTTTGQESLHSAKPGFFGLVRGEFFKQTRQLSTWISLIIFVGLFLLIFLVGLAQDRIATDLQVGPTSFVSNWVGTNLMFVRVISGFVLIVLTARTIGQEYNQGTIRIILARGVGRVQLLLAKLASVVIWAILILLLGLALNALLTVLLIQIKAGNLDALSHMDANFGHDLWVYVGVIAISMGTTILLTAAFSVLTRSLAGGLSFSLIWFPADNIGIAVLFVIDRLTHNDGWLNIGSYLLGPNLNVMINSITGREWSFGSLPANPVDGTHTLVVTLVYALIFALVAVILTWKRDVKE
jgi:ABC-2 type transport system permease protein